MVLSILLTYKNLILQTSLSLSLTFILTFLKIPTIFLHGLFTYIHPDDVKNGVRAAIRRPGSSNSGSGLNGYQNLSTKTGSELKKRIKSKEKFEFDENQGQIFRLKMVETHLQTRLYFNEYRDVFNFTVLGTCCLLVQSYLGVSENSGVLQNGIFVPISFGVLSVYKVFVSLGKISFEKLASRRLDKQLSVLFGVLGFVLGLIICFSNRPLMLDFDFTEVDGFVGFSIALFIGCFAAFLFMPSSKNAKSFWLGTDQIRCNLEMISCGWFGRMILYANYLVLNFTALLWISPVADILVNKKLGGKKGSHFDNEIGNADELVGNLGFSQLDFSRLRIWCLFLSGFVQILAVRSNLQMYLNEALLSWYQRLNSGKVPDLSFSREKVFLHDRFLCLALLQFLVPPALVLLFVSLSQIDGNSFGKLQFLCNQVSCSALVKEVPLFMAWWVVFVSAVYTSASILLHRRGILYVS